MWNCSKMFLKSVLLFLLIVRAEEAGTQDTILFKTSKTFCQCYLNNMFNIRDKIWQQWHHKSCYTSAQIAHELFFRLVHAHAQSKHTGGGSLKNVVDSFNWRTTAAILSVTIFPIYFHMSGSSPSFLSMMQLCTCTIQTSTSIQNYRHFQYWSILYYFMICQSVIFKAEMRVQWMKNTKSTRHTFPLTVV